MLLLNRDKRFKYEAFKVRESIDILNNPFRGWYKIVYYSLGDINETFDEEVDNYNQSLMMLFIDIGKLKKEEFSNEDIEEINQVIERLKKKNIDLILRFAYDHFGKALEREPISFRIIEKHARTIVDIVNNNDNIFVLQGLIIGNWGEMHSSRFVGEDYLRKIGNIYGLCNKSVYLAVRTPSQWRILNNTYNKNHKLVFENMGLFNDGMFGSETDLGTYSSISKKLNGYFNPWQRTEELDFINEISLLNPMGGEVVSSSDSKISINANMVKNDLRKMCVTYLNSQYDINVLDKWKQIPCSGSGGWNNKSLYDYVEAHLGYRFIITDSTAHSKNGCVVVQINIKNSGFSPVYRKSDVFIEIDNEGVIETHVINGGLNTVNPGEEKSFSASFKLNKGTVYAYSKCGSKRLLFANEVNSENKVELGRLV